MHTEDFVIDESAYRKVLERLTKLFPYFHPVFVKGAFAGIFEAVDLVDEAAFVIASEHVYFARVTELLGEK